MHSAALPLMKGARRMFILHSPISLVHESKANGTSPYPLRKGDIKCMPSRFVVTTFLRMTIIVILKESPQIFPTFAPS